jgi:hypothetical protein
MQRHLVNLMVALMLAALIGLASSGGFTATADAGVGPHPVATGARLADTDFGAARRPRHARRARSKAEPVVSPPPSRPSYGYGIGDNSTYGGG